MAVGGLVLYDTAVWGIFSGALPGFLESGFSAHLLNANYSPDIAAHQTLADLVDHELTSPDAAAKALTGVQIMTAPGRVSLVSDPIIFGDPISVAPFRFLLLAYGLPSAAANSKQLLGYVDLSTAGGALEVVRGQLSFSHGAQGWLSFIY